MKISSDGNKDLPRIKKTLFIILSAFLAIILFLFISEAVLRIIKIPGIEFNVAKYDPLVGHVYYPHSTQIYRNDRGDHVRRKINQWGYLDKDHEKEKSEGVYRIGFFGDSFTKAIQVPLEQTFFRLIEDSLRCYDIETLAFGVSGFSTLQSYLTCKKWADFFDIDLAVYVFYENDPGDQIPEVKREKVIPYPVLTENGFTIDNSFREIRENRNSFYFKIFDYLTARSLVFATISNRLKLLLKHGINISVTEENRHKTRENGNRKTGKIPSPGDRPSAWPDSLREYAKKLERAVLLKWEKDTESSNREFVVMTIPQGPLVLADKNSWRLWIKKFCREQNIAIIDSTPDLINMELTGKETFYDHLTKFGHIAFSRSFLNWFKSNHDITLAKE